MEQLFEILNVIFVGPDIPGLNKSIAPMVAAAGISAVVSLGKGIFGALSAMIIELIPTSFDDNLTIPLFSGTIMYVLSIVVI